MRSSATNFFGALLLLTGLFCGVGFLLLAYELFTTYHVRSLRELNEPWTAMMTTFVILSFFIATVCLLGARAIFMTTEE
jgi:hypothetical protein